MFVMKLVYILIKQSIIFYAKMKRTTNKFAL